MSLLLCCVQWAVKGGHARSVAIAKHLLSAGVDARATNNGGSTALHWAATGPVADISRALIALLLEQPDVYVNAANNAGETPLHWAVDWVRPHAVQALLSAGADVSKVDRDGNSPLHKIKADCDESEESVDSSADKRRSDVLMRKNKRAHIVLLCCSATCCFCFQLH